MVNMERRVVIRVTSVMSVVLRLYFRQRMVPYVATGMAMTTVLMLTTYGSKPSAEHRKYNPRGMSNSRKRLVT